MLALALLLCALAPASPAHAEKATNDESLAPVMLEIRTVPPMPGVRFSLDGQAFVADVEGIARAQLVPGETYRLEVLPVETAESAAIVEFNRWGDAVFVPYRDVRIKSPKTLEVGFNVSYLVRQTFFDLAGYPVDPERVTSLTLKSSYGAAYTFEDGRPRWLQASRVARRQWGLEETEIQYSVESVIVDGSSVVNRTQQRFLVNPDDEWQIELLLYSAHFTARDALFGIPVGTGIRLENPDGSIQFLRYGPEAEVVAHSLARGTYRVSVAGAQGISPPTPVALSRDQEVALLVISYVDIAVAALLAATLGLGLLFSGRPDLLTGFLRAGARRPSGSGKSGPPARSRVASTPILAFTVLVLVAEVAIVGLWRWVGTTTWEGSDAVIAPTRGYATPARAAQPGETTLEMPLPALEPPAELLVLDTSETPATDEQRVYVVQTGDTLQRIAGRLFGDPDLWVLIYEANRDQIKDPDLIYRGQEIRIPDEQAASPLSGGS